MKKNNVISYLICFLIILIYVIVQESPILFMWLCWMSGYFKDMFDYFE